MLDRTLAAQCHRGGRRRDRWAASDQQDRRLDVDASQRGGQTKASPRPSPDFIGPTWDRVARKSSAGNVHFCVEDESGGIFVRMHQSIREGILENDPSILAELEYGVDLDLEGRLGARQLAPIILPTKLTILGRSEFPEAPRPSMRRFLRGADDVRRVTVRGVVQNIADEPKAMRLIRVETGVGYFLARLPMEDRFAPLRLLDAEVEIVGVAAASQNWRSEFVCPRLVISRDEDFRVLVPAPADPFKAKRSSFDTSMVTCLRGVRCVAAALKEP